MRFGLRDGDGQARSELLDRIGGDAEVYLTTAEAALVLAVTPATVRRWADAGRIRAVRSLGGHRRFPAPAVMQLLRSAEAGNGKVD